MLVVHPIFWIFVAAVAAPLLAEIPVGFRVPVVVLEVVLGAFAAGMIIGQATRGEDGKAYREKIDAVYFGWFFPFFFVGTGVKFDAATLGQDLTTLFMVPSFAVNNRRAPREILA